MSEMSRTYWWVSLHLFCPLQFIPYVSARGIFLLGMAMHSNDFRIKTSNLIMAHKAVKDLPLHNSAAASLHTFLLPTPPPSSTVKTTEDFHFLHLTLLPSAPASSKMQVFSVHPRWPPVNLLSQFLFILPASAALPLPHRNLSESPRPSQTSSCPVS